MRKSRSPYERLASPTTPTFMLNDSDAPPRAACISKSKVPQLAPPQTSADPLASLPNPHQITYTQSMSVRVSKGISKMMKATERAVARDKHHEDKAAKRDAHHDAKAQAKAEAEAKHALRADRRVHDHEEEKHRHQEKRLDRDQRKKVKEEQRARKEAASKRTRQMGGISWGWDPDLEHQGGIEVGGRGKEVEFPSQTLPSHRHRRHEKIVGEETQGRPSDTSAEGSSPSQVN